MGPIQQGINNTIGAVGYAATVKNITDSINPTLEQQTAEEAANKFNADMKQDKALKGATKHASPEQMGDYTNLYKTLNEKKPVKLFDQNKIYNSVDRNRQLEQAIKNTNMSRALKKSKVELNKELNSRFGNIDKLKENTYNDKYLKETNIPKSIKKSEASFNKALEQIKKNSYRGDK